MDAHNERNVVLIGMRCTGKTTVSRLLAERLGRPLVDTDEEIVNRAGKPIARIFADDGQDAFRELERQVVADTARAARQVISTGGGVVLAAENVRALRANGFVVWLQAKPETIQARMQADTVSAAQRPALTQSQDALDEVRQVYDARRHLYSAAADMELDTERYSPAELAQQIIDRLRAVE